MRIAGFKTDRADRLHVVLALDAEDDPQIESDTEAVTRIVRAWSNGEPVTLDVQPAPVEDEDEDEEEGEDEQRDGRKAFSPSALL